MFLLDAADRYVSCEYIFLLTFRDLIQDVSDILLCHSSGRAACAAFPCNRVMQEPFVRPFNGIQTPSSCYGKNHVLELCVAGCGIKDPYTETG